MFFFFFPSPDVILCVADWDQNTNQLTVSALASETTSSSLVHSQLCGPWSKGAVLHYDNARSHRARVDNEVLQLQRDTHLDCPARSLDLSPIEHLWDVLGDELESTNLQLSPSASFLALNGKKISWFNCFLLYCTWLEKENYIENVHVLSCFVLLKSVLLISCVFWILTTCSTSCNRWWWWWWWLLACEDFGRMFDTSFPDCVFFFLYLNGD